MNVSIFCLLPVYFTQLLKCVNRFQFVLVESNCFLVLSIAPQVEPTLFPLAQCEPGSDGFVTYACIATGFFPESATFRWDKNGENVLDVVQYPPVKKENENKYSRISQINVNSTGMGSQQDISCTVEHLGKPTTKSLPVPGRVPRLVL